MGYEEYKAVADNHRKLRRDFLNGELSEDAYLAHKAEWEKNQKAFDESRGEAA